MTDAMVSVRELDVSFGSTQVLHKLSFDVARGRTVGVVGESGSGKSTLAKVLVGTVTPEGGEVSVDSIDVNHISRTQRGAFAYRRRVQMIPQDPFSSLSPRRTIGQTLAEALDPIHASVKRFNDQIAFWLERVGLSAEMMSRYPHEFSGGQRQRVAIARSLILEPSFVIADEITSALDVSVQAQILDMIAEIKEDMGLTMMFISHNLAVVQNVSDEVIVLYRGEIVEAGPVEQVYAAPQHWYTRKLLDADPGAPGFRL
ncbi:ABC-type glutathione transport system ATPase component [Microbacterium endophyticum]|uniref:ABC-type glutathione transport system ATPase component n=1 Tax=Microbacterium endophyticum TaxID=1526412 RepID=A0A7W4YLN7_9MICO|nr:ATP-binding cassette domain-containing protein [Microbacterium endophyticum]MBB2975368.1 ABC-type glutathione transport system ATPase component [Microbacterium endophyticum]NIK35613.1 ABC-type glutathione transport system ATPase component [Microbacterium endophyticum]